jgi:hypothetical protein
MQKKAGKKIKYKSLFLEIQHMWTMKCIVTPVMIGATGIATKALNKNLEAIPGKHSIYLQKNTTILETSHIIWKVLQSEIWQLSRGYYC